MTRFIGVLQFQRFDFFLRRFRNHAFAVQFAVRARMRLIARRQEVGRNIALGGDIGNDFNLVFNIGHFGEKFGFGIAFQNILGDAIARLISRFKRSVSAS
jgi:hypothetical protein